MERKTVLMPGPDSGNVAKLYGGFMSHQYKKRDSAFQGSAPVLWGKGPICPLRAVSSLQLISAEEIVSIVLRSSE